MKSLYAYDLNSIRKIVTELKQPAFRAKRASIY